MDRKKAVITLLLIVVLITTACANQGSSKQQNNTEGEMPVLLEVTEQDTAENVIEKVHEFASDADIVSVVKYSDDVGSGLQIKTDDGKTFNVYMYSDGAIFGIKDIETQKYLYAVQE